jgi:N-acetylglucosaminyldiphosphoundecaprenol N-acetyl-beta-D-mannosaminyltransferase
MEQASKLTRLMKEKAAVIFRICRPAEMLSLLSKLKLLIGMRLHSAIFAAINAVPMLGLAYDPKVESFLKSIHQPCFSLESDLQSQALIEKAEEVMINSEKIKVDLVAHREQLFEKAKMNFDLLAGLFPPPDKVVDFAGIKVDNLDLVEALQRLDEIMHSEPGMIVTPNPEMIVTSQHDEALKSMLNSSRLRIPDGISMVVVSRLLGHPLKERVTGIDLMLKIIEVCARNGYRVFLLGGGSGVAEEAAFNLGKQFPKLRLAGTYHGYFKEGDDLEVANKIRQAGIDILFVGLGAGRQEKWLNRHLLDLGIKVGMCVGGSFDVISGRKKRAPVWIQKLYIEWLYRLLSEPNRWKRQLALPKFLWLMFFGKR